MCVVSLGSTTKTTVEKCPIFHRIFLFPPFVPLPSFILKYFSLPRNFQKNSKISEFNKFSWIFYEWFYLFIGWYMGLIHFFILILGSSHILWEVIVFLLLLIMLIDFGAFSENFGHLNWDIKILLNIKFVERDNCLISEISLYLLNLLRLQSINKLLIKITFGNFCF